MRQIEQVKMVDDLIVTHLVDDEDGTESYVATPLAAIESRSAILGLSREEAFAALLIGEGDIEWAPLYHDLWQGGPGEAAAAACDAIGVRPGDGIAPIADLVSLQPGRLEEIEEVLASSAPVETPMSAEDVAMSVQVGDIAGKVQRYASSTSGLSAEMTVSSTIADMRSRAGRIT